MMMKLLKSMSSLVVVVACCVGCVHTCPKPEVSMECYPICKEVKEKTSKDVMAKWENFKSTPDYNFVPIVGYPKTNEINRMLCKLGYQVKHEIVIPYIELDREGLIAGFYEFEENVKCAQKAQGCDQRKAMELVYEDWSRQPGGREKCQQLARAIPLLQQLKASNQICNAITRLSPNIFNLLQLTERDSSFKNEYRQLMLDLAKVKMKGDAAAVERIIRLLSILPNLKSLSESAVFLSLYLEDKSSQRQALEKFIADIAQMSAE